MRIYRGPRPQFYLEAIGSQTDLFQEEELLTYSSTTAEANDNMEKKLGGSRPPWRQNLKKRPLFTPQLPQLCKGDAVALRSSPAAPTPEARSTAPAAAGCAPPAPRLGHTSATPSKSSSTARIRPMSSAASTPLFGRDVGCTWANPRLNGLAGTAG